MGQPFPQLPNGQFLQGLPQTNTLNPAQAAAMTQAMQGVDPRMLAMAQQQMANPNSGDILGSILPGPKEAALGAGVGMATALGLSALIGEKLDGPLPAVAKWIDELKGVSQVSQWLETRQASLSKRFPFLSEGFLSGSLCHDESGNPILFKDENGSPIRDAKGKPIHDWTPMVSQMEEKHLGKVLDKFPNRLNPEQQKAYDALLTGHQKAIREKYTKLTQKGFEEQLQKLGSEYSGKELAYLTAQLNQERQAALKWAEKMPAFTSKQADWLAASTKQARFQNVINATQAKLEVLEELGNKATKEQKHLYQSLRGLKERINGLNNFYKPSYESQAKLAAKLAQDKIGPIGRTIALGGQYLQRIFNGETLSMGSKGFLNKGLLGPIAAGALIFGMSFKKSKEAKEGEKTKTFFHDFFGSGIANFIGWELGKKWLNSTGLFHKVLGRFATKRPFDATRVGRWMPFFGENFGKMVQKACGGENILAKGLGLITGKGLGGFFSRLTLGGLATELTAMFAFGSGMQWVGEKIAHAIFGKPSQESIDGPAAKNPSQQAQQAMMAGGPAQNPMLAGQYAPPTPNAGTGWAQPNTAQTASLMAQAQQRAMQQQRAMPQFSISPEQISHNGQAQEVQGLQSQILKANQLTENKNHGRPNYFDPNSF
jgi:hypothetical protein